MNRRFLLQVLLCINVVIWSVCFARADEKPISTESKAAYLTDTFDSGGRNVEMWRFDPARADKHPAIVLLHGSDGIRKCKDGYCSLAKSFTAKGYVVFAPHYFDCTGTREEDLDTLYKLVQRGLRGTATAEENEKLRDHFERWIAGVRDAIAHIKKQANVDGARIAIVGTSLGGFLGFAATTQEDLGVSALVSCSGGFPAALCGDMKRLPPTLAFHGDKDEIVPVEEAHALKKLADEKQLPVEVKIYPNVGHVLRDADGKFNMLVFLDAQKRAMVFLRKHLRDDAGNGIGK